MRREYKVVLVGLGSFLVTFGGIFLYWLSGFDASDCTGEECGLEYAAVVTWGLIVATLIGVACGFVAYVLTGHPQDSG